MAWRQETPPRDKDGAQHHGMENGTVPWDGDRGRYHWIETGDGTM